MGLADEVKRGSVLVVLTLRYLLTTRRVVATALLASVPILLTGSLAAARVATFDILLFQALMVPLFLQVVLIFVTLVNALALIREEIEDQTLPYLLTRPVSKPTILGSKYAGYLIAVLLPMLPSVLVAYGITEAYAGVAFGTDLDVLAGFLLVTVLGCTAYGAFFLFLSVLVRKPLAAGLLFGFVWESIVGSIPGDVPKLSLIHYLRSILKDVIRVGPMSGYPTDLPAGAAAGILLAFTMGILLLAAALFQQAEFKQKA